MRRLLPVGILAFAAVPIACGGGGGGGKHPGTDGPPAQGDGSRPGIDGSHADGPLDAPTDRPTARDSSTDQTHATDGGPRDAGDVQNDGGNSDTLPPCTSRKTFSASESAAFFPYQVGARWRFQVTGRTNSDPTFSPSTFLQERQVTGTRTIGTTTAFVVQSSNVQETGGPVNDDVAVDPAGLVNAGSDAPASSLNYLTAATPYTAVPFPIDGCASFVAADRSGIDYGYDLDGDGVHESVAVHATTTLRVQDLVVPVGTFPGALRVETTILTTLTRSKTNTTSTTSQTQVDWYGSGVGPIRRWSNDGSRTYDYQLVAYSVGGVSRGVLPSGAIARDLSQSSANPYQPNRPTLAFDGSHFLVVVPTAVDAPPFYEGNLQSFVIAPDSGVQPGSLLLPTNYAVTGVVAAFGGSNFMLAYNHNDAQSVEVMPVSTAGARVSNPVTVATSAGAPSIVPTASGFLIAYVGTSTASGIAIQRSNVWMVPVGPTGAASSQVEPFPASTQGAPYLATDGSTIMALWSEYGTLLLAARFDATGHPLDSTPLLVSSGQCDSIGDVQFVFDGTQFVALWTETRAGRKSVRVARVTKNLQLLDGPPNAGGVSLGDSSVYRQTPRLGRLGTGSLVIWDGQSYTPSLTGVMVTRFTADGQLPDVYGIPGGILALGSVGGAPFASHPLPEILWGGDRAALVWLYPPAMSQSVSFGLDYGFAYPWDGGGAAPAVTGTGGAGGMGGMGGAGGAGGSGGQTVCGFTMPTPASTGLPNPASYDTGTAGLVVDRVTGLTWDRQLTGAPAGAGCTLDASGLQQCPQAAAAAFCAADRTGGFADWRLPSVLELTSLVDYTQAAPAIDQTTFPGTPGAPFWTATPYAASASFGWTVNFSQGLFQRNAATESHNVRCVRGAAPPSRCFPSSARYQVAQDMTTDQTTGLVWQSYGNPSGLIWMDAAAYCAVQGMRLPTIKESVTLLDFTQTSSNGYLVDRTAFPNAAGTFMWSSSVAVGQYMSAWSLSTQDGSIGLDGYYGNATETRCVR